MSKARNEGKLRTLIFVRTVTNLVATKAGTGQSLMPLAVHHTMNPEQSEAIHAAIGRFATSFERMVHALATGSVMILESKGLSEPRLGAVMVDGLTADPLRRIFFALLGEVRKDYTQDASKIVKALNRQIQDATNTRNEIIHRTWFVGFEVSGEEVPGSAFGLKTKNTLKGVEPRPLQYTPSDFDQFAQEFLRLESQVYLLMMSATQNTDPTLAIRLEDNGKTSLIVQGAPEGYQPKLA